MEGVHLWEVFIMGGVYLCEVSTSGRYPLLGGVHYGTCPFMGDVHLWEVSIMGGVYLWKMSTYGRCPLWEVSIMGGVHLWEVFCSVVCMGDKRDRSAAYCLCIKVFMWR